MTPRIGIVGAGGIVRQRHLPGLRAVPGVEIVAVANSALRSAEAFCRELAPEAEPMARWEDLVARPDLDIVWIGATPHLHKPVTLAALQAGKHVFCQARMAMNLADAEEMLEAAKAHPDLVTMLCPPPQGLEANAFVRKLLAEKVVGEPRAIRLHSLNGSFLDPSKPAHWRQRREINGLNILSLGIHAEVLQRWFGNFSVRAAQGRTFTPQREGYPVLNPDTVQILADFENGALGTLEFSGVHAGEPIEVLEISGTLGVLTHDYAKNEIRLETSALIEVLTVPLELHRPWQVEADFLAAVRNPSAPRPHPDFADGVRYMAIVQRVNDLL